MSLEQAIDQNSEQSLAAISKALCSARRSKSSLSGFPGAVPVSLNNAYKIQDLSILEWSEPVAGWKVGGVPPEFRSEYQADRLVGPIFRDRIVIAPENNKAKMSAFRHGFAAVEPEFVMELGDISGFDIERATPDSVAAIVRRCFAGIEVASSPVPDINGYGPAAIISDFGNNSGLVIGPELDNWRSDYLAQIPVSIDIDGVSVGNGSAAEALNGPLGAVLFLIKHLRGTTHLLAEGVLVSTGAITGVHEAKIGSHSRVCFEELTEINLELVDFE